MLTAELYVYCIFSVSRPLPASSVAFLGLSEPGFMAYYTFTLPIHYRIIAEKPKKLFSSKPQGDTFSFQNGYLFSFSKVIIYENA
jgi:hypothetical protein